MSQLCAGLNHLSRAEAQRLWEERLRQCSAPVRAESCDGAAPESQDSDWLDGLDHEAWEELLGGPDEGWFEGHYG